MASIKDDNGHNQGFELVESTVVRMKRRADLMIAAMDDANNKSILEIGCGTGEVAFWIAEKVKSNVLGTDICVPFVDGANEKYKLPNLSYEVLDFNNAEHLKGRTFDYIIGNGILHHLYYNLSAALTTLKDLLKDNGKIIFMEPNIYNPYVASIFKIKPLRKIANLEPDEMAFSKSYIIKELQKVGFKNCKVDYKDFLLPGIPSFLIKPSIAIGDVAEKIPFVKNISQSIFIIASKN